MSGEESRKPKFVELSDEEWLEDYERQAEMEPTKDTELAIRAAQWLVDARKALQDPEADKFFLRMHRGVQDPSSKRRQRIISYLQERRIEHYNRTGGEIIEDQYLPLRLMLEPNFEPWSETQE